MASRADEERTRAAATTSHDVIGKKKLKKEGRRNKTRRDGRGAGDKDFHLHLRSLLLLFPLHPLTRKGNDLYFMFFFYISGQTK